MKKIALTVFMPFLFAGLIITDCCDKEDPEPETTTETDIDSNVCNTIQIFNRTWMTENLKKH